MQDKMYTRQDECRTVYCRGYKHIHGQDTYALKLMQDKMYTRQDERRTVWCRGCKHIHGQDAYTLKQMQDKMYTEQEGCRTGRMQVMANKGHDGKKADAEKERFGDLCRTRLGHDRTDL